MFTPKKFLGFRTRKRWRSRAQYLRAGAYRIFRVCARLESRAVAGAFGFPACCVGGAGGVVCRWCCRAAAGDLLPGAAGGGLPAGGGLVWIAGKRKALAGGELARAFVLICFIFLHRRRAGRWAGRRAPCVPGLPAKYILADFARHFQESPGSNGHFFFLFSASCSAKVLSIWI